MKIQLNKITWYSKWLALALFVAIPFLGFYFGIRLGEARQYAADIFIYLKNASSTAAPQGSAYYENVSEWQTDRNNAGWSIAYPIDFYTEDFYAAAPADDWRQGMPGGSGLRLFALTIPKAFEPQTNFSDAVFNVGMSGNADAVSRCLVSENASAQTAASKTTINGTVFTVFRFTDAGAGNIYETTSYRTIHANQCWAVEYTIHSAEIGNYPPEYGLKPFDETKLHDVLDRIAGTFRFE